MSSFDMEKKKKKMDRRTTPQVDIYLVPYMFLWGREWACREKKKKKNCCIYGRKDFSSTNIYIHTHIYIFTLKYH